MWKRLQKAVNDFVRSKNGVIDKNPINIGQQNSPTSNEFESVIARGSLTASGPELVAPSSRHCVNYRPPSFAGHPRSVLPSGAASASRQYYVTISTHRDEIFMQI